MADQNIQERISKALEADIPQIYFNTSVHVINTNDVMIVLERNQKPVAILNTSWGQAKALVEKLNGLLQGFERASMPIKTAEEIGALVAQKRKKITKKKATRKKATKKSGKIKVTIH